MELGFYWLFVAETQPQHYKVTSFRWSEREFEENVRHAYPRYEPVAAFDDRAVAEAEAQALNFLVFTG